MKKTHQKKGSDLIVFKTLRRQIAIQEGKQQANKQTQKDPSSETERGRGRRRELCQAEGLLTAVLLDIETIPDS